MDMGHIGKLFQRGTMSAIKYTSKASASSISSELWKTYLIYFAGEHFDFQVEEIKSIATLLRIPYEIPMLEKSHYNKECPFLKIRLQSDVFACQLMSRSVLCKKIYELWASTSTWDDMCQALSHELPEDLVKTYKEADDICMSVSSHGKRIGEAEYVDTIGHLLHLIPLTGKINLDRPRHRFTLIRYHNPQISAEHLYFGRRVCESGRNVLHRYRLSKRLHIGNTSMDTCLAFTMCNQALVKVGDIVFDPFCGSGSILVSAAHLKAYVIGSDIDYLLLHGLSKPTRPGQLKREKNEGIRSNLMQYGLGGYYLDVVISDASNMMWRESGVEFDAIITDPPYGVRERSIKVGTERKIIPPRDDGVSHYPEKVGYGLRAVLVDLLRLAVARLRLGGRLVFWLPVHRATYDHSFIPTHPALTLVANSEQILSSHTSRRLLTMEKTTRLLGEHDGAAASCADVKVNNYVSEFRKLYFTPNIR